MDKATIVSVVPYKIREVKHGMAPNIFEIQAADQGDVSVLVVNKGTYPIYMSDTRRTVRYPIEAFEVAESVVRDYASTLLAYADDCGPGMFAVSGEYTKEQVKREFADRIEKIRRVQNTWLERLVQIADDDWARYHQYKLISDIQRFACKALNLTREWNSSVKDQVDTRCPMCFGLVNTKAVICIHCHFIMDRSRYDPSMFTGSVVQQPQTPVVASASPAPPSNDPLKGLS